MFDSITNDILTQLLAETKALNAKFKPAVDASKTATVYVTLNAPIAQANNNNSVTLQLDRAIISVDGISLTTDNEVAMQTLTNRLEINGTEIFPQEYEAKALYTYPSVEGDKRYSNLDKFPAGNQQVKITTKDLNPGSFTPYNVRYYLKCTKAL